MGVRFPVWHGSSSDARGCASPGPQPVKRLDDDSAGRMLMRVASGLKLALIVTIYFSICAIIIILIIGRQP
jgi:hypothetical protein